MVVDYMVMTQPLVWGSPADDVVWKTFMTQPLPEGGNTETLAVGFQEKVITIESMGFTCEAAAQALHASHGSMEAALEYLVTKASSAAQIPTIERRDHLLALVEQLVVMG